MTPLGALTEAGNRVRKLERLRDILMAQRDSAAWSLNVHSGWSNPRVRALFGTASHDAWTKSRKRMAKEHPEGAPVVPDAEAKLVTAVARLAAIDALTQPALDARVTARKAVQAVAPGVSQSELARAAGLSRQAMHAEMKKAG